MAESASRPSDPIKKSNEPLKPQQPPRSVRFKTFLYDKKTKKVCGRTCVNWFLLSAYYVFAWAVFVALFAIILRVDFHLRNRDEPQHNILNNLQPILAEPGLATVPRGTKKGLVNVIHVWKATKNIKEINNFLADYPKNESIPNCNGSNPRPCSMKIDIETLGPCSPDSDPTFGYSANEPCVLIKINQIWGWKPRLYASRPADLDAGIYFSTTDIPVSCQVWTKFKDETFEGNFTEVSFYPPAGFSENCFPFCGKRRKYVQPFVMAKFKGLQANHTTGVLCLIYARNIKDSRQDKRKIVDNIGSFFFAIAAKSGSCNFHLTGVHFALSVFVLLRHV